MVFVRHEGRKNHGSTRETQTVKCYKCGKEIEMGELFFSKASHSRGTYKTTGHICESCYQSLFIDL